jgi:hypothetical protein
MHLEAQTLAQYGMVRGRSCEACGAVERLRLDHHHASGAPRGTLCHGCNTALGYVLESPERLRRLADYIERKVSA